MLPDVNNEINNRLAKREIRHIAENVFQEFHSSAHGMRVTDLVRALQTLIEGDNARYISVVVVIAFSFAMVTQHTIIPLF